jgi:phage terminase Nu1 subunit (DNA packaging protein)
MKTTYPIKTICQILDLTERRVHQLVTDGILPKNSERGRYELIPTVKGYIHWLRDRSLYGEVKAKSGNVVSLDEARRRKLIAEAELAELELQKERGEVVSIEETEKSWTEVIKDLNSGKFPPIIHAQAFCVDKTAKVPEDNV